MHSITSSGIRTIGIALAALLSIALFVAVAPKAHAADMGFDYIDTFTPDSFGPSFGGFDYIDTFTPSYDFGGFDYIDTFTPGFSDFGGFGGGSGFTPFSTMGGGGGNMQSQSQSQGQSQSQSSNNTNVNNNVNSININIPQAQPTVAQPVCPVGTQGVYPNCVYPQPIVPPTYDICPNLPGIQSTLPVGYVIQYGNCQYPTPVYPTPAPQPYISLSQTPYTGLELGTMGTIAYWGFLVLWSLMAAYLIAVKKVQNKVAAWFTGSTSTTPSHTAHVAHIAHAPVKTATVGGIDPFIASQIHRAK